MLLFDRVFSELCGRNSNRYSAILFGIELGLKLFFTVFARWIWWWGRFVRTVHITVAVGGHSESKVLPH